MKISVIIQTYNAAEFLEKVLFAVKDFEEIVICDMYSTDETVKIAEKYNCKIVFHKNTKIVEPAREFAISQASNEWVLVIDADELVTVDLKEFLYNLEKNNANLDGLYIPRKNFFMGKFMHSAYPDYVLRFFKKSKTKWPPIIHAKPIVDGHVLHIPKKNKNLALIHLSDEPITVTIEKMNRYTNMESVRRSNKNYSAFSLLIEPFVRFLRFYLFKGGLRDGKAGFIWACMYSYYKFVTIVKVLESKNTYKDNDLQ